MLRRIAPALLTVLVVALGVTALAARPPQGAPQRTADFVVLAGIAGLRWEDVDPQRTPTLWRMAQDGSIGSLSVRSAHRPTCPVDGWLTLGAGSFAAWNGSRAADGCPAAAVTVEQPDGIGANLPDQESVVQYNQQRLPWGAMPGSLSESVRCSVAVGPGAAVAAARPFGRVDRYAPAAAGRPAAAARLVCAEHRRPRHGRGGRSGGPRRAGPRGRRRAGPGAGGATPAVVGAGRGDLRHRPAVAAARGGRRRAGLGAGVAHLGQHRPRRVPATCRPRADRPRRAGPADAGAALPRPPGDQRRRPSGRPGRGHRRAGERRPGGGRPAARSPAVFFALLAAVQVLLALAILPLLRRARPHAGPAGPTPVSGRVVAVVELLLVAAALTVPAALLADAVPWWRGEHPGVDLRRGDRAAGGRRHRGGAVRARVRGAPSGRSARWPASPRSWSGWTCSPGPASSSTAWSATRRCRAAGTPG